MNSYLLSKVALKSESEYYNKEHNFEILKELGPNQLSQNQMQQYCQV